MFPSDADTSGWIRTNERQNIFPLSPCKIEVGEFYKHLSSFTSIVEMPTLQIESYRSKHNCKNLIETLYALQRERIPGYQTEYGLFTYSQLKRAGYSERERKKMVYVKDGIPRYPSLQGLHFEQDCMDILERWEQWLDKKPKRKREWKERWIKKYQKYAVQIKLELKYILQCEKIQKGCLR